MAKCVPDADALHRWLELIPATARYGPEVVQAPSYCYITQQTIVWFGINNRAAGEHSVGEWSSL